MYSSSLKVCIYREFWWNTDNSSSFFYPYGYNNYDKYLHIKKEKKVYSLYQELLAIIDGNMDSKSIPINVHRPSGKFKIFEPGTSTEWRNIFWSAIKYKLLQELWKYRLFHFMPTVMLCKSLWMTNDQLHGICKFQS